MRYYAPFKFPTTMQWLDRDRRIKFSVRFLIDFQPDSEFLPELKIFHLSPENGQTKEISYSIWLTNTRCHFGGNRYWFRCPLSKNGVVCNRRVGVLYFNGRYFGCRHCLQITYESQSINYHSSSAFFITQLQAQDYEEEHLKRYTWRGKPTRQMRRLQKLYARIGHPDYPALLMRHCARGKNIQNHL